MKRIISWFFIFLVIIIPHFLSAESRNVVINEIAWMGTPVAGIEEKQWWRYEWIELYNAGDTVGMLDGWKLELYREKLDFTVSLKGTIVPNGYYVVGASEKIPHIDLNYKNLGGKFFNGGQKVVLKNNLGEIMDVVDAQNGWPAGDNKTKQTMERKGGALQAEAPSGVEGAKAWQTSKEPGGTPQAQNSEGYQPPPKVENTSDSNYISLSEGNEKDLLGSSSLTSFQSRVPIVNPITLLAGLLALGFSGVLLLVKRSLALRQKRQKV